MTNSRAKGAAGERELAEVLRGMGHTKCRRGQQFSGSPDSPDVCGILGVHPEVKRVQSLNLNAAMDQAVRDAGSNTPAVFHRRNNKPWLVTVRLADLEDFMAKWKASRAVDEREVK